MTLYGGAPPDALGRLGSRPSKKAADELLVLVPVPLELEPALALALALPLPLALGVDGNEPDPDLELTPEEADGLAAG
jgi:hypothetical protein